MNDTFTLTLGEARFGVERDASSAVAQALGAHLPLSSMAQQLGGEIYFRIPGVEIPYEGTQTRTFRRGDVVYWRAPNGDKTFSIAVFCGPTPFGTDGSITAASPCVRVGHLRAGLSELEALALIRSGDSIHLDLETP